MGSTDSARRTDFLAMKSGKQKRCGEADEAAVGRQVRRWSRRAKVGGLRFCDSRREQLAALQK